MPINKGILKIYFYPFTLLFKNLSLVLSLDKIPWINIHLLTITEKRNI